MVFILLKVTCCEGCWKQEREALIALNSRLGNAFSSLDNTDCCQWEGVECNTTTRRVTAFKLQSNIGPWHLNYSDLIIFKDLKSLYLSSSQISNCSTTNQGYFSYKLYILIVISITNYIFGFAVSLTKLYHSDFDKSYVLYMFGSTFGLNWFYTFINWFWHVLMCLGRIGLFS